MADVNSHLYQDLFRHRGFRDWLLGHRQYHNDDFGDFLDSVRAAAGDWECEPGRSSSLMAGEH